MITTSGDDDAGCDGVEDDAGESGDGRWCRSLANLG